MAHAAIDPGTARLPRRQIIDPETARLPRGQIIDPETARLPRGQIIAGPVDIAWIFENGLVQKLTASVRCF